MDNKSFDEFDFFLSDLSSEAGKPRSLAEIVRERGAVPSARELCESRIQSFRQTPEPDPFTQFVEREQAISQARIAQEIQRPVQVKKATATTEPEFDADAKPEVGDLAYLVGLDQVESEGDPQLPVIAASFGDHILSKREGGQGVLAGSFADVMQRVAARASGGAAVLARRLAREWRESV